ncbi:hypothetical protein L7F22_025599, partial [Adiantum nelumboides]|nr:hypothetical protein [Adiantum nelumboides]
QGCQRELHDLLHAKEQARPRGVAVGQHLGPRVWVCQSRGRPVPAQHPRGSWIHHGYACARGGLPRVQLQRRLPRVALVTIRATLVPRVAAFPSSKCIEERRQGYGGQPEMRYVPSGAQPVVDRATKACKRLGPWASLVRLHLTMQGCYGSVLPTTGAWPMRASQGLLKGQPLVLGWSYRGVLIQAAKEGFLGKEGGQILESRKG